MLRSLAKLQANMVICRTFATETVSTGNKVLRLSFVSPYQVLIMNIHANNTIEIARQ